MFESMGWGKQFGILGVVLLFALLEWRLARRRGLVIHDPRETWSNFGILAGGQVSRALFLGWQVLILSTAHAFAPVHWPSGPWSFVACFFFMDFLYYWQHRAMHEIPFFWAFHLVHHSGQNMNLTTAFRLNWFSPLVGSLFYLPAILVGFSPMQVLVSIALNLLYQYWLHTELIGVLPAIEGVLNTPSAHRVHHGSNPIYIDCNYGGVLMLWDRLFGTYRAETQKVIYGVTTGPAGYNPIVLNVQSFLDLARGKLRAKG